MKERFFVSVYKRISLNLLSASITLDSLNEYVTLLQLPHLIFTVRSWYKLQRFAPMRYDLLKTFCQLLVVL